MSYLPTRRIAVGGVIEDLVDRIASSSGTIATPVFGEEAECNLEGSNKTQDMFLKRLSIRSNWNPTGFYTPADLKTVVDAGLTMMREAAGRLIDRALADSQTGTAREQLAAARSQIFDQEARSLPFIAAVNNAVTNHIDLIEATSLKRWVLGAMEVAEAAVFTVTFVSCTRPWLLGALTSFFGFFRDAADLIMSVAGAIYKAGQIILKVPDALALAVKVSLVGGAALGAWWLWKKYGTAPRKARR